LAALNHVYDLGVCKKGNPPIRPNFLNLELLSLQSAQCYLFLLFQQALSKALDVSRSNFDCGDEEIYTYLRDLAVVAEEERFSKAFLMLSESNQDQIAGFYTLSNIGI